MLHESSKIIPYFPQSKDWTCGPACMRMLLGRFGVNLSEEELARALKTTQEQGTKQIEMCNLLSQHGVKYYSGEDGDIKLINAALTRGELVLVEFMPLGEQESHYCLVTGLNEEDIIFFDPDRGPNTRFSRTDFETRWFDTEGHHGWYLIIAANQEL